MGFFGSKKAAPEETGGQSGDYYTFSTPFIQIKGGNLSLPFVDRFLKKSGGAGMVDATKGVRNASAMAEALAIKNAAKKFGRVFGRGILTGAN